MSPRRLLPFASVAGNSSTKELNLQKKNKLGCVLLFAAKSVRVIVNFDFTFETIVVVWNRSTWYRTWQCWSCCCLCSQLLWAAVLLLFSGLYFWSIRCWIASVCRKMQKCSPEFASMNLWLLIEMLLKWCHALGSMPDCWEWTLAYRIACSD